MAHTEDTYLYHRGGAEGAAFVKVQTTAILAAPMERRIALTQALDEALIDRWLSPSGSADLLALALFLGKSFPVGLCALPGQILSPWGTRETDALMSGSPALGTYTEMIERQSPTNGALP